MPTTSTDLTIGLTKGPTSAVLFHDDEHQRPPVLFVVDVGGVRDRTLEMARRIADEGYAVLVPHILHRKGERGALFADDLDDAGRADRVNELISSFTPRQWADDLPYYLDTLTNSDHTTDETVRVVGYCMGGMLSLRAAIERPERIRAAAGFHPGGLVTRHLDSPHRHIGAVTCPLFFAYADHDRSMTADAIETLRQAAEQASLDLTGVVYEGAAHGFTMSDRPAYDEAATERHWGDLLGFFARV